MAEALLGPDFFSGWGIRTLVPAEKRFNPLSDHNGGVWPHDGAVIARGALKWKNKDLPLRVLCGMIGSSRKW